MEHNEFRRMSSNESAMFDARSRDVVYEALTPLFKEVTTVIDSSQLKDGTKKGIHNFLQQFANEFEDDGIVERGWVTFDSSGNIIRARSAEGVYDVQNTFRYLLEEMEGKFFNPLAVSFLNESQKEMREVKNAVRALF